MIIESNNINETLELGQKIAAHLKPGDVLALTGNLGAGKTWLSKGIARGLGVSEKEYVNSPAFDLVHEYHADIPIYHMDFYRMDELSGEDYLWLEEYLFADGICIIEWAEKFLDELIQEYLKIKIFYEPGKEKRSFEISANGIRYLEIYNTINRHFGVEIS